MLIFLWISTQIIGLLKILIIGVLVKRYMVLVKVNNTYHEIYSNIRPK